ELKKSMNHAFPGGISSRIMTEQDKEHREQYHEARRQFDDLKLEDKAVFLLESTVSTLARGLEELGRAVADSVEKSFEEAERAGAGRAPNEENVSDDEPPSSKTEEGPHGTV
ncbi:MAG: hypothetical protein ACOCSK_00850, partial [Rhodothermales bacterium]